MPPQTKSNISISSSAQQQHPWDLTTYDMQRSPHKQLNPDELIECCPQSVLSDVTCPICLGILKDTMTTKECLHRFCERCITTALRNGNKECPSCRKKLVSKRSLRPDYNFDKLIEALFPDRTDLEDFQNRITSTCCSESNSITKMSSRCSKYRTRAASSCRTRRTRPINESCHKRPYSRIEEEGDQATSIPSINVLLIPRDTSQSNAGNLRRITLLSNATIHHLKMFLHIRKGRSLDLASSRIAFIGGLPRSSNDLPSQVNLSDDDNAGGCLDLSTTTASDPRSAGIMENAYSVQKDFQFFVCEQQDGCPFQTDTGYQMDSVNFIELKDPAETLYSIAKRFSSLFNHITVVHSSEPTDPHHQDSNAYQCKRQSGKIDELSTIVLYYRQIGGRAN